MTLTFDQVRCPGVSGSGLLLDSKTGWTIYMNIKTARRSTVLAYSTGLFVLAGFAIAHAQYVDPKRSTTGRDLTQIHVGLFGSAKAQFEYQTQGSLSVGYSLVQERFGGDYLRLTIVIKNTGTEQLTVMPTVTMNDGDGFLVTPQTYNDLRVRATELANGPVVPMPAPSTVTTTTYGTIRNQQTGEVSSVSATSTTSPGSSGGLVNKSAIIQEGIAKSQAQAASIDAENNRRIANEYLQWLPQYWLKDHYEIPAGASVAGALLYSSHGKSPLPITVSVRIGDQQFTFRSHYE